MGGHDHTASDDTGTTRTLRPHSQADGTGDPTDRRAGVRLRAFQDAQLASTTPLAHTTLHLLAKWW